MYILDVCRWVHVCAYIVWWLMVVVYMVVYGCRSIPISLIHIGDVVVQVWWGEGGEGRLEKITWPLCWFGLGHPWVDLWLERVLLGGLANDIPPCPLAWLLATMAGCLALVVFLCYLCQEMAPVLLGSPFAYVSVWVCSTCMSECCNDDHTVSTMCLTNHDDVIVMYRLDQEVVVTIPVCWDWLFPCTETGPFTCTDTGSLPCTDTGPFLCTGQAIYVQWPGHFRALSEGHYMFWGWAIYMDWPGYWHALTRPFICADQAICTHVHVPTNQFTCTETIDMHSNNRFSVQGT